MKSNGYGNSTGLNSKIVLVLNPLLVVQSKVVNRFVCFVDFLEGMSELDDKVAHLRQDMSLHRRQLENKRGDDEVSVWLVFEACLY